MSSGETRPTDLPPALASASYNAYGPFGRRVSKTVYGVSTGYLYDGSNVVQELSGSTPSANLLSGGLDEVFTRTDSSGVANFIRDGIGSTAALTDSTGAIEQTYTYDPFGATATNGGNANSYQYIGRETDATGLYYFRARYYDPAIDRFISEDPIGLAGGDNVYAYAYDDPLGFTDPFGLKPPNPPPPCGDLGVNCQPPKKHCGTGFGLGFQGGADTALGAGYAGTAGTVGTGAGLFFGSQGVSGGAYASGGATAYAGSHVRGAPAQTMGPPTSVGAGLGPVGGGFFITNASSASQLGGPFQTFGGAVALNVGLAGQVSLGYDGSGNFIWQAQLSWGYGWGLYGYSLTTNTKPWTTGDQCE